MILVTGAAGLNGSAAVRAFAKRNEAVRALVRSRERAAALAALPGVELVEGDMRRPETLGPSLDGVSTVLLISSADARLVETQCTFLDAAKGAGVQRVVKFSGLRPEPGSDFRFMRMHAEVERHLQRSGLAWTLLCPSQFMQVYFRETPSLVADGVLALPMGAARLAPVDVEDIAEVAYALLHRPELPARRWELTGPEALTMGEIAERLSRVLGRAVRHVDVSPAEKRRRLLAAGAPVEFVDAMDELFEARRRGLSREDVVNLSTHQALGVRPTTFAEFAERNAAVFRGERPGAPAGARDARAS